MWDLQQQILRSRPISNVNIMSVVVDQAASEIENLPDEEIKKQILIKLDEINELMDKAWGGHKKDSIQN